MIFLKKWEEVFHEGEFIRPYIYMIENKRSHRFYIGSKIYGGRIGVDYFTSSSNEKFRMDFEFNPGKYNIYILGVFDSPNECHEREREILSLTCGSHDSLNRGVCSSRVNLELYEIYREMMTFHINSRLKSSENSCGNEKFFKRAARKILNS